MSEQETFDLVVAHARKQGCKSMGEYIGPTSGEPTHGCVYRGENGTACFAGALIPNDEYKPEMEGRLAGDCEVAPALQGHNIDFVRKLQNIHDCYEVSEWEYKLADLAERYGLTYTPPAV